MRKAFLITCHAVTNPLIHTVRYFSSFSENYIFIHVDKKVNIQKFQFLESDNVFLISDRYTITWGGFSQVLATIALMKTASLISFEYMFLLSGDDIPLKTNESINKFLRKNHSVELIHYQNEKNVYVDPDERVRYSYPGFFFERNNGFYNKLQRMFFSISKKIIFRNKKFYEYIDLIPQLYKGTNWFGLSAKGCSYILKYLEDNVWMYDVFKYSLCPDEVFFHSILKTHQDINLYDDPNITSNALRYVDWIHGPDFPRVLQHSDKEMMLNSDMMFARKIPYNEDFEYMRTFLTEAPYE